MLHLPKKTERLFRGIHVSLEALESTNLIALAVTVFLVWQFMMHCMICMPRQPDKTFNLVHKKVLKPSEKKETKTTALVKTVSFQTQ